MEYSITVMPVQINKPANNENTSYPISLTIKEEKEQNAEKLSGAHKMMSKFFSANKPKHESVK